MFNLTLFTVAFCFLCWFQYRPELQLLNESNVEPISDPWGDDFIRVIVRDEVTRFPREASTAIAEQATAVSTDDLQSQLADDVLKNDRYDLTTPYETWTLAQLRNRCDDINVDYGRKRKATLIQMLLEHDLNLSSF